MRCRQAFNLFIAIAVCLLVLWVLCFRKNINCLEDRFHHFQTIEKGSRGIEPFIFIGGYPRSGTTLMRVLLDVHYKVRCGPETRVLPRFLRAVDIPTVPERKRLEAANINEQTLDAATVSFVHEIISRIGNEADRFCVKDPFIDNHIPILMRIFPNSKFIFMVRDGRAVVNSVISRNVSILNVDWRNPELLLHSWNKHITKVAMYCADVGSDRCLTVQYEQLVLRPRETMIKVLKHLDLPWDESIMSHEKNMDDIYLVKSEKSSNQVVRPIYTVSLDSWARKNSILSANLIAKSKSLPMLKKYGYADLSLPPVYGVPEEEVAKRTN